ncbi:hypothetical protein AB0M60_30090, partial [Micromonospora wenchangensis]
CTSTRVSWNVGPPPRSVSRTPVTALTVLPPGLGRYRTGLTGWYVDRAGLRAVTVDGRFYLLTVPSGVRARLFGVDVPPARPPLVVGRGGRDGESIPLADLLARRLTAGDDWP